MSNRSDGLFSIMLEFNEGTELWWLMESMDGARSARAYPFPTLEQAVRGAAGDTTLFAEATDIVVEHMTSYPERFTPSVNADMLWFTPNQASVAIAAGKGPDLLHPELRQVVRALKSVEVDKKVDVGWRDEAKKIKVNKKDELLADAGGRIEWD